MDTPVIKIAYRKIKYKLVLEHKITRIIGESATGKTSLTWLLDPKNEAKIQISGVNGYSIHEILPEQQETFDCSIRKYKNAIVVMDERHYDRISTVDVARAIRDNTTCYFIIIGRGTYPLLNIDISAIKKVRNENGINTLVNYVEEPTKEYSISKVGFTHCMLEDTGKAYKWFNKLFGDAIKLVPSRGGKTTYCADVEALFAKEPNAIVLLLFDRISFGDQLSAYMGVIERHKHRIFVLLQYKSWEYLMLKSNIFKERFIGYPLDCGMFEEKYYEMLLEKVSASKYGTIKHEGDKALPKCYTETCCYYTGSNKRECSYGLTSDNGEDKFTILLDGTEFAGLLKIANRA